MVRFVQNVHILHLCVYLPSEHLRRPKSSFWVCNSSYHIFRNDHCILLCLSPHSVTSRADIFQQQKRICTFIWSIQSSLLDQTLARQVCKHSAKIEVRAVVPHWHSNSWGELGPLLYPMQPSLKNVCTIMEIDGMKELKCVPLLRWWFHFLAMWSCLWTLCPPIPPRAAVASSYTMQLTFQTDSIPTCTWRNDMGLCLSLADIRGIMIQKERCQDYDEQNQWGLFINGDRPWFHHFVIYFPNRSLGLTMWICILLKGLFQRKYSLV